MDKADQIIQDMGGVEILKKFLPLSVEQLSQYAKAGILDKMVPPHYWKLKLGFDGNGVTTFYRHRINPPIPIGVSIDQMVLVMRRVLEVLMTTPLT